MIAAIYKDRWQIEIYFKTIKQNLRIKTFVGTSPNALLIQIWTALIAVLILKYLKFDRMHFGDIFGFVPGRLFLLCPGPLFVQSSPWQCRRSQRMILSTR